MKRWEVPVNVVDYGRTVVVEAETAQEAKTKARTGDWIFGGEATRWKITVVGKPEEVSEEVSE